MLRATLKADLIGFHTYDYARHFISSCTRILGLEGTPEGVEDNGRCVRLGREGVAVFFLGVRGLWVAGGGRAGGEAVCRPAPCLGCGRFLGFPVPACLPTGPVLMSTL